MLLFYIAIPAFFISDQVVEGRLGPSTVVLDHTSGFEGLLLVDDDLLGVSLKRDTENLGCQQSGEKISYSFN